MTDITPPAHRTPRMGQHRRRRYYCPACKCVTTWGPSEVLMRDPAFPMTCSGCGRIEIDWVLEQLVECLKEPLRLIP